MTNPIDRCPGAESLQALLDDLLDPGERAAVSSHAAACGRCGSLLAEYRRLDAALRGSAASALRPEFAAETLRVLGLAGGRPRARALSMVAAAAAVAAVIAVGSRVAGTSPAEAIASAAPPFGAVASLDLDPRALGARAAEGLARSLGAIRLEAAEPAAANWGGVALAAVSLNGLLLWLARRGRGGAKAKVRS